jgi:DNA-binding NtrC family response regulator
LPQDLAVIIIEIERKVQMSKGKILVVDDELFVRDLLLEFLGREGFEVVAVESGERALETVKVNAFQIALIDLKMPGINGLETLKEIRNISPLTQNIIMTGYPTIESSIEALRSGAYDYVVKPFKLSDLKASIDKASQEYNLKIEIGRLRDRIKNLEEELKKHQEVDKNLS